MSTHSGKLDPQVLTSPLQGLHKNRDWLRSRWLFGVLGGLALMAVLAQVAAVRLPQMVLILGLLVCLGLLVAMSLALQHVRHRARMQALLDQLEIQSAELESLRSETIALRQQDQEKAKVLSVLAHDLRTPFASLKNMLWLLEQGQLSAEEAEALLPRLRGHVDGLYSSLDNLLVWSRNQTCGRAIEIQPVPLAAVAREMTEVYRPAAQQKQIELIAPKADSTLALADIDALRLILRNLLDNAIKFTPSGGSISLGVHPGRETVLLRIEDTGIGMNTGQLEQLFSTGKGTRRGTAGEKGFGLGMQLCRSYAEQSGGSFAVTSRPGKGTRFDLRLPALNKGEG